MTLAEKNNEDIKTAMRAKDAKKLEALRAIKSGLLILKTGKGASGEIPQNLEMGLLKKLVKQRKESAAIYRDKDRAELAEVEEFQAELKVGDKVVTTSGIYGVIAKVGEKSVHVQIADKVRIEMSRASVGGYQGKDPVVTESGSS